MKTCQGMVERPLIQNRAEQGSCPACLMLEIVKVWKRTNDVTGAEACSISDRDVCGPTRCGQRGKLKQGYGKLSQSSPPFVSRLLMLRVGR